MTVQYLTVDGVIALHEIALEYGGGLNGIRSQQTLASAIGQAEASAFGEDAYPTIPEKAAAYGFFIAEVSPLSTGTNEQLSSRWRRPSRQMVMSSRKPTMSSLSCSRTLGHKVIDQSEFFSWVCNHARPQQ